MRWKYILIGFVLLFVPSIFAQTPTINPELQGLLINSNQRNCSNGLDGTDGVFKKLLYSEPSVLKYCTNDTSKQCTAPEFKNVVCSNLQIGKQAWQFWISGSNHDCKQECELWGTNGDYLLNMFDRKVNPYSPTTVPPSPTPVEKPISYCTKATEEVISTCTSTATLLATKGCDAVAINEAIDALPANHTYWTCGRTIDANASNEARADILTDCAILQFEQISNSWGGGSAYVCQGNWVIVQNEDGTFDKSKIVIDNRAARDLFVERALKKNISSGALEEIPDNYDIVTPTPGLDLGKFDQQLNNTICGTGAGESCCLQTEGFDTQGIPDPTGETGKSGGFFGTIWTKIQSFMPGFMKSGQHIAIKTLNRIQEGQGLCPGDPMLSEIDQPEIKPYLWVADEEGNKTDRLYTDENAIRKIDKLLTQVQSSQTTQVEKDRIWKEELGPALEGKACSCEIPSEDDWSKPAVSPQPVGLVGSANRNVLGASEPEVLGILDAENSGITDIINYCMSLDPTERQERFQNSNMLTCQATMGNTVLTARQVCGPIKNVPGYDEKEYASCFECVVKDDGVWTAVGCFYSDFSRTLNERIFGLAVSIAGMVALGCIIYAAFLMQTSGGNPERTGKAQELMTACITGLVVIIFSIFILRVIGVDILRLPGFEGPTPTPTPSSDGVCTYIGDPDCAALTPGP